MTDKAFSKGDVAAVATKLAKEKIEAQPERFRKMDPGARLAAARSEIYQQNPELVDLDHEAR